MKKLLLLLALSFLSAQSFAGSCPDKLSTSDWTTINVWKNYSYCYFCWCGL